MRHLPFGRRDCISLTLGKKKYACQQIEIAMPCNCMDTQDIGLSADAKLE